MSSKQKNPFKQKKVKTILKQIEKAPPDDIRELFRVSDISKEGFVHGIMEFPISEQEELIDAMLQDTLLDFLLHDSLTNWLEISNMLKLDTLETAYAILYVESKAVDDSELKLAVEKLVDRIEQFKKNNAERKAISAAYVHGLKNTLGKLRHLISLKKEDSNSTMQILIEEVRKRTLVHSSVEQKENKEPAK